jgi:hypothetical protein
MKMNDNILIHFTHYDITMRLTDTEIVINGMSLPSMTFKNIGKDHLIVEISTCESTLQLTLESSYYTELMNTLSNASKLQSTVIPITNPSLNYNSVLVNNICGFGVTDNDNQRNAMFMITNPLGNGADIVEEYTSILLTLRDWLYRFEHIKMGCNTSINTEKITSNEKLSRVQIWYMYERLYAMDNGDYAGLSDIKGFILNKGLRPEEPTDIPKLSKFIYEKKCHVIERWTFISDPRDNIIMAFYDKLDETYDIYTIESIKDLEKIYKLPDSFRVCYETGEPFMVGYHSTRHNDIWLSETGMGNMVHRESDAIKSWKCEDNCIRTMSGRGILYGWEEVDYTNNENMEEL